MAAVRDEVRVEMMRVKLGWQSWWRLVLLVLAMMGKVAFAQVATTTVQDTVYRADGTVAGGTVLVSWGAFTTAAGQAVPAGTTSATIGAGGVVTLQLAPNAGATPMGTYYTAAFHLNDGTTSRQYWVVPVEPVGAAPVKLAAIENQVLPTSVAMQTVSKQYVDTAIAQAALGIGPMATAEPYVLKTGDTMTGPLVLPGDPVSAQQAADKSYVDNNVAGIAAGLGGKVALLPSVGQVVSQPTGTQLQVNHLNGELYASQYATGVGNNGIANAVMGPDCASGCTVQVEPSYASGEQVNTVELKNTTAVLDGRGGEQSVTVVNPLAPVGTGSTATSVTQVETLSPQQLQALRPGALAIGATAMALTTEALTGGSNLFPDNIETPPYFKNTYGVLALHGVYNTQGQHVQFANQVDCYGVGDCLAGGQFITSSGGYRDRADEGAHPFDLQVREDSNVFDATCSSGCTTGSTNLTVAVTAGAGTQGDGRFLIDTNPAKVITTGQLVGGASGFFGIAYFSGTSFPVSVFLETAQAAVSQPANMAPGTVTLPIATSGQPAGYATSTAALSATSGLACVNDSDGTPDYEMAPYTVVDATHLQLTLAKPHIANATITVGGLCGYGVEQTVDTHGGIRQVFPVVGSMNATTLYYADAGVQILGSRGPGSTSGYVNGIYAVASIARTSNVVSVTLAGPIPDFTGSTLTISGVADASYNGTFVVTSTGQNSFTYPNTGANSTSSGGTVTVLTGGYALYPMAEVLSVYNPADGLVDGTLTLGPNNVAWASGDTVEEPHYYRQSTYADTELVTQYMPRPIQYVSAGKTYLGLMSTGARGWVINNATPTSYYAGAGGTYTTPDVAYQVLGPWTNDFDLQAGTEAVLRVHCNLNGCNRWDSGYKLFELDGASGTDSLSYNPVTSTTTWSLGGGVVSMSGAGITANALNVGTLNATSINGNLAASALTSGTVSPARLPVFGPSGAGHSAGAVPDPGATAGATRYLREDGAWVAPPYLALDSSGNISVPGQSSFSGTATFHHEFNSVAAPGDAAGVMVPSDDTANTKELYGANHANSAYVWWINNDGSVSFPSYTGPATAPSGACAASGAWVFSQDGHATFCAGGTWVTKL
jgi:hypothetical protein